MLDFELQICELYTKGKSGAFLSSLFNIPLHSIYRLLRKHKVNIRSTSKITQYSEDICKEYQEGKPASSLAKKYNVHYVTILNVLHKNNITITYNREYKDTFFKELYEEDDYITQKLLNSYDCKPSPSKKSQQGFIRKLENKKRIDNLDHFNICQDYLDGISKATLCKKYNISPHDIDIVLKLNNITKEIAHKQKVLNKTKDILNRVDHFKICQDYLNGKTLSFIIKKYKINYKVIDVILKLNNITKRTAHQQRILNINKKDGNKIIELFLSGKTKKEIAQILKLKNTQVQDVFVEPYIEYQIKLIEIKNGNSQHKDKLMLELKLVQLHTFKNKYLDGSLIMGVRKINNKIRLTFESGWYDYDLDILHMIKGE